MNIRGWLLLLITKYNQNVTTYNQNLNNHPPPRSTLNHKGLMLSKILTQSIWAIS